MRRLAWQPIPDRSDIGHLNRKGRLQDEKNKDILDENKKETGKI